MSEEIEEAVEEMYMHIGNSGVTLSVCDEGFGPKLVLRQSTFGSSKSEVSVLTTKECIRAAAILLYKASFHDFSDEYCHAAGTRLDEDSDAGKYLMMEESILNDALKRESVDVKKRKSGDGDDDIVKDYGVDDVKPGNDCVPKD